MSLESKLKNVSAGLLLALAGCASVRADVQDRALHHKYKFARMVRFEKKECKDWLGRRYTQTTYYWDKNGEDDDDDRKLEEDFKTREIDYKN